MACFRAEKFKNMTAPQKRVSQVVFRTTKAGNYSAFRKKTLFCCLLFVPDELLGKHESERVAVRLGFITKMMRITSDLTAHDRPRFLSRHSIQRFVGRHLERATQLQQTPPYDWRRKCAISGLKPGTFSAKLTAHSTLCDLKMLHRVRDSTGTTKNPTTLRRISTCPSN